MPDRIGEEFQQRTKYVRETMRPMELDFAAKPETFKHYPDAETIELPPVEVDAAGSTLGQVLAARRSKRKYTGEPMTLAQLSYLLWSAQGVTARMGDYLLRAAPSAGALYPVETYVVVNNVIATTEEKKTTDVPPSPVSSPPAGGRGDEEEKEETNGGAFEWPEDNAGPKGKRVPPGVYHYDVRDHRLECVQAGDFRRDLAAAALDQVMCVGASVVFVWTAVFARSKWKYGQRAYRYVYLDAGHIAAHVALAAVALGLGSCQIAALFDDECNRLVAVDGVAESTLYMTSVGCVKRG